VLVSLSEYLDTDYSPDREYVDGVVMERHVGERPHSRVQINLGSLLDTRYPLIFAWSEQRITTIPGRRARIPDICVTLTDPEKTVFDEPPFLAIEILSRLDRMVSVLAKLAEYQDFGIPHIWLVDPHSKKAFRYEDSNLKEATGSSISAGEIDLPLADIFRRL